MRCGDHRRAAEYLKRAGRRREREDAFVKPIESGTIGSNDREFLNETKRLYSIALDRPMEVTSTAALGALDVEYLELADQIAEMMATSRRESRGYRRRAESAVFYRKSQTGRLSIDSLTALLDRDDGLQKYRGGARSNGVAFYVPEIRPGRSGQASSAADKYVKVQCVHKSVPRIIE